MGRRRELKMGLGTKKGEPNRGGADTGAGPGDGRPYQEAVFVWAGPGWDGPEEEPEEGGASSKSEFQLPPV